MEALQETPAWLFGVQITSMFDWTAIGSVLVFLTLLQAIWLANTGNRRIDAQQSVTLTYVRIQLIKLSTIQKISAGAMTSGIELHKLESLSMIEDLEKALSSIDPIALPTASAIDAVEQSKSAVLTLRGLYDPDNEDRELYEALLPFSANYTQYAIKMLDRELEDRQQSSVLRLWRKFRRGAPPKLPETFLGSAMRDAKEADGSHPDTDNSTQ